jgi:hypothetical protein
MRLASRRSITLRKRHTTPVVDMLTCLYSVKLQPWDHVMLDYVSYVYVQSTATRGVSRDSYGQTLPSLGTPCRWFLRSHVRYLDTTRYIQTKPCAQKTSNLMLCVNQQSLHMSCLSISLAYASRKSAPIYDVRPISSRRA